MRGDAALASRDREQFVNADASAPAFRPSRLRRPAESIQSSNSSATAPAAVNSGPAGRRIAGAASEACGPPQSASLPTFPTDRDRLGFLIRYGSL